MRGFGRMLYSGLASYMLNSPLYAVSPMQAMLRETPRRSVRQISILNRSRRWRPAYSYQQARLYSPYPERPVR